MGMMFRTVFSEFNSLDGHLCELGKDFQKGSMRPNKINELYEIRKNKFTCCDGEDGMDLLY